LWRGTKCYRIYPGAQRFSSNVDSGSAVACLTLTQDGAGCSADLAPGAPRPIPRGPDAIFDSMKRKRFLSLLPVLLGGLIASAWGRASMPLPPPPLPPGSSSEPQRDPGPVADGPERAGPSEAPGGSGREPQRDFPRGYWRNLSPDQREAIRRLSQEEREALANRSAARQGGALPPGARLSPKERRQLRDQIREEHERRGGRRGRRP